MRREDRARRAKLQCRLRAAQQRHGAVQALPDRCHAEPLLPPPATSPPGQALAVCSPPLSHPGEGNHQPPGLAHTVPGKPPSSPVTLYLVPITGKISVLRYLPGEVQHRAARGIHCLPARDSPCSHPCEGPRVGPCRLLTCYTGMMGNPRQPAPWDARISLAWPCCRSPSSRLKVHKGETPRRTGGNLARCRPRLTDGHFHGCTEHAWGPAVVLRVKAVSSSLVSSGNYPARASCRMPFARRLPRHHPSWNTTRNVIRRSPPSLVMQRRHDESLTEPSSGGRHPPVTQLPRPCSRPQCWRLGEDIRWPRWSCLLEEAADGWPPYGWPAHTTMLRLPAGRGSLRRHLTACKSC